MLLKTPVANQYHENNILVLIMCFLMVYFHVRRKMKLLEYYQKFKVGQSTFCRPANAIAR